MIFRIAEMLKCYRDRKLVEKALPIMIGVGAWWSALGLFHPVGVAQTSALPPHP